MIHLKNLSKSRLARVATAFYWSNINWMTAALRTFVEVSMCMLGDWMAMYVNRRLFCSSHMIPSSSALKSSLSHPLCRPARRYHRATNFVISGYVRQPRQTFPPLCATRRVVLFVRSFSRSFVRPRLLPLASAPDGLHRRR